jgi:hypothetical protein
MGNPFGTLDASTTPWQAVDRQEVQTSSVPKQAA